jgi:SAM-dependent methyltransferase
MYEKLAEFYDRIFPFNPEVPKLIRYQLKKRSAKILDIGCGTGKYIGFLSNSYHGVGIDPDKALIKIARRGYFSAEFIVSDLFSYTTKQKFDLIFSVGNVISYIPGHQIKKFIRCVEDLLTEDGVWLFQTMNWDEILKRDHYIFPVIERDDVKFEREYRNISKDTVDFKTSLEDEEGHTVNQTVQLYPQTERELIDLHRSFKLVGLYGNYAKAAVNPNINSKIFIFRK